MEGSLDNDLSVAWGGFCSCFIFCSLFLMCSFNDLIKMTSDDMNTSVFSLPSLFHAWCYIVVAVMRYMLSPYPDI